MSGSPPLAVDASPPSGLRHTYSSKSARQFKVALAGNPNCGKTTLFNSLTGLKYKVANYPGVTVEKKSGKLLLENIGEIALTDLPGIYTLAGFSVDERIATQVLEGSVANEEVPDAVILVVDSTNLERNLYLATQLIDRGLPLVVALNMCDLAAKRGITVYGELLSRLLDVPLVPVIANAKQGISELCRAVEQVLTSHQKSKNAFAWLSLDSLYAKKAVELGELIAADEPLRVGCELLSETQTVIDPHIILAIEKVRGELEHEDIDSYSYEAARRYTWINSVVRRCSVKKELQRVTFGDRVDRVTTHQIWGVVLFVLIMTSVFQSIFLFAPIPMELIENGFQALGAYVGELLPAGQLRSLIVDGIFAGVGSVVVFVPQIAILFFFLGLLEDSGYLARAAFIMDRVMRPVGLQGRSFIPLLSSFACAIPGILSARTIPSWSDRMATILVAPLMSCSARLPVYTVLIAAFIPPKLIFGFLSLQGLVLFLMYALGVFGAALVSWTLKRTLLHGKPALFVMEMPPFRVPSLKVVLREVWDRVVGFLQNAGTMILACSIILWFLASYPRLPENASGNPVEYSFAGRMGKTIEPMIKPLGFDWQIGVGLIASFAAREVFVSSLATVYNLEDQKSDSSSLVTVLQQKRDQGIFTVPTALSLMVFYVFACQCMSTLAVCKRETGGWKWPAFMFAYMTVFAYAAAALTYTLAKTFITV